MVRAAPDGGEAPREPQTVSELRHAIDHGAAADKVDFPDPAAAPLGTDAEAGGTPPTRAEVRLEARSLRGNPRPARRVAGNGAYVVGWTVMIAAVVGYLYFAVQVSGA